MHNNFFLTLRPSCLVPKYINRLELIVLFFYGDVNLGTLFRFGVVDMARTSLLIASQRANPSINDLNPSLMQKIHNILCDEDRSDMGQLYAQPVSSHI